MKKVLTEKWSIEDVLNRADEADIKISKKEASEVLIVIEQTYDACIGINWDVIDWAINEVLAKEDKGGTT